MKVRPMKKVRKTAVIKLGLVLSSAVAPFAGVSVYADGYFVPSITLAGVYDDNIFVTAGIRDEDYIARATPGLEGGYISPKAIMRASYARDLETYGEHSELNSNSMREFADVSIDYQANAAVLLAFDFAYTLSQVPSELNLSSVGLGAGRTEGERTTAKPGMEYRFSETATGLLEYMWTAENLVDGIESTINQLNGEFEHAINSRNQMIYGYSYSQYEFTNGLTQHVHTPRVGLIHDFSERTMITAQAGPRIEEDTVDVNASVILSHIYSAGQIDLRYDRDVTTLIGEAGIVQVETVGASLVHRLSSTLEVSLTPSFGEVSRPRTDIDDAEIYRIGTELRWDTNDAVTFFASYSYSYQESTFEDFDPTEIPRNLFTLGMTLRLPNRNSLDTVNR